MIIEKTNLHNPLSRAIFTGVRNPCVNALMFALRGSGYFAMKLRADTDDKTASKGLFGRLVSLGASIKIKVNGFFKSFFDFLHRITMESYDMANPGNPANETFVFFTVFNLCSIAFICYRFVHGFTSNCSRNSRAALTWYGLASFPGCGRWKSARKSPFLKPTREPLPSINSHPSARNKASIFRHSKFRGTGSENIAANVFRRVLFMFIMILHDSINVNSEVRTKI